VIEDLTLIWMIETVKVIGGDGTEKYFVKRKQYRYSSIVYHNITDSCGTCVDTTMKKHYRVIDENGESFDVNEDYCVDDDKPRKVWEQSYTAYLQHISDQPKDVIEAYKEITGIVLSDQNMPVTDGGDERWQEHLAKRKENNGKQYGQVELHTEDPV